MNFEAQDMRAGEQKHDNHKLKGRLSNNDLEIIIAQAQNKR